MTVPNHCNLFPETISMTVLISFCEAAEQKFLVDCPSCCCPNSVHAKLDENGDVRVWTLKE